MTIELSSSQLKYLIRAATAAPSLHNSQPWRFRAGVEHIDVFGDPTRRVGVLDPDGRELNISCGAAILNLRVALRALGHHPHVRLMPMAAQPDLVARVSIGSPAAVRAEQRALEAAIWRRHTHREPFDDRRPSDEVRGRLTSAARQEGADLHVFDEPVGREVVLSLVRTAETRWRRDPEYRRELAQWTTVGDRDTGVPVKSFGPFVVMETVPQRDYSYGRPAPGRRAAVYEAAPTIAVLTTLGDRQEDWLRAGMALERVLLEATVHAVAAGLFSQPLEQADLRELLSSAEGGGGYPQMVLRLGYGEPVKGTPRRSPGDVIDR